MEENTGFNFTTSLYAELLSQLAGSYANVPQELRVIRGEISELTNKTASLSEPVDSADLIFDTIRVLLDLLKHSFDRLFPKVDDELEGPSRQAIDQRMDISTGDHGPIDPCTNNRRSSTSYHAL